MKINSDHIVMMEVFLKIIEAIYQLCHRIIIESMFMKYLVVPIPGEKG